MKTNLVMLTGLLAAACLPAFADTIPDTPEPATAVLVLAALLGGGTYSFWKRRKK